MAKFFVLQSSPARPPAEWQEHMKFKPDTFAIEAGKSNGTTRASELAVILKPSETFEVTRVIYGDWIIQDRVVSLLAEKEFAGWFTRPVSAIYADGVSHPTPHFSELVVTGWGGIAPEESGIKKEIISVEERVSRIRKLDPWIVNKVKGGYEKMIANAVESGPKVKFTRFTNPAKLIDEKQWDGSDLLRVWPIPHLIFVTEALVKEFADAKITGVCFTPIDQLPIEVDDESSGYGPGRLALHMPDPWASKYGIPLGIY